MYVMDEFIEALIKQAGLTEKQAEKALEVIIGKVKTKVPESFHGAIDSVFGPASNRSTANDQTNAQSSFGSHSERSGSKLEEFGTEARKRINELAEKVEGLAEETRDKAEELIDLMRDRLNTFLNDRERKK